MKKTKILKTIMFSLILVILVLLLNSKVLASAITGDAITSSTEGTITVKDIEKGVQVSVYQLTSVNYDDSTHQPTYPPYTWNENVKNWLSNNAEYAEYATKFEDMKNLDTDEAKANFYDAIAAAIKSQGGENSIELTPADTKTVGDTGTATTEPLPMGTYLILIENGVNVYRPSVVNLTPKDVSGVWTLEANQEVTIKSSPVGITFEGSAKSQTVSAADTIVFDFTANVPKYPSSKVATTYAISGVLENGLALTSDKIEVYGMNGSTKEDLSNTTDVYTLATERPNSKGTTDFTLNFDYSKISGYENIYIKYKAKLNQDETTKVAAKKFEADGTTIIEANGNKSTVYLDYSNNPYDTTKLTEQTDTTYVFTHSITIYKKAEDDSLLAGASFELMDGSGQTIKFVSAGNGVYYKSNDGDTVLTVGDEASGENKGKLELRGLDNGTYTLKEQKAPNGYNKLTKTEEITIDNASESRDIINSKGFELPLTGGMGTVVFTASGILLVGLGLILLVVLHKKKENN